MSERGPVAAPHRPQRWRLLSLHQPLTSPLPFVTPVATSNHIQHHLQGPLSSLLAFCGFHHACLTGCSWA